MLAILSRAILSSHVTGLLTSTWFLYALFNLYPVLLNLRSMLGSEVLSVPWYRDTQRHRIDPLKQRPHLTHSTVAAGSKRNIDYQRVRLASMTVHSLAVPADGFGALVRI